MKILIVEDEKPAAERLQALIEGFDQEVEIMGCLESIEDTVSFLNGNVHPDLMLLDIHLSDGNSFEILRRSKYQNPVIFTTAYDHYAIDAFKFTSIDYILKPVTKESLAFAFNKYRSMTTPFSPTDLEALMKKWETRTYKKRFVGKVGQRLFFIDADQIAYFQADNKILYMVDFEGTKYVVDYTIEKLEQVLDPKEFFRVNRRFMVNIKAIELVKPYVNSRVKLVVKGAEECADFIISRSRMAEFRQWAE